MRRERYPAFNLKEQSTSLTRDRFDWRRLLTLLGVALILLAPSIWMLAKIPPLWRDADAYDQIVLSPAKSTSRGQGPLYGMVVRAPLYLGQRIEHAHQLVTDTGIYLLICLQHLALVAGGFSLILAATKSSPARVLLAFLFASNSVFYTLAHCVGSESLSLLCLLALAFAGLRLLKRASRGRWICFAIALLLFLLTRYVNWFLVFTLPATFVLIALRRRVLAPLRQAAVAAVIGFLCLAAMRFTVGALTKPNVQSYYPHAGFTFLWRLSFLEAVPEPRRSDLLDQLAARTSSDDVHKLISTLRAMLEAHESLEPVPVYWRFHAALDTPEKRISTPRFYQALYELARAFLLPPTVEHWRAAEKDFVNALRMPMSVVSTTFFVTTVFCFEHQQEMPELMMLSTFRNYTAADLMGMATSSLYFTAGKNLSLGSLMIIWAVLAVAMIFARDAKEIFFYGLALVVTGVVILQASAMLINLAPRYTLPLWELLWLASIVYLGAIADAFVRRNEKPAGQQQLG